jgi:hypothetical protein
MGLECRKSGALLIQKPKKPFFTRAWSAVDWHDMLNGSHRLEEWTRKVCSFFDRCWRAINIQTAAARGKILLEEWLSPEQRAQFEATNSFEVIGCHTGKRYRIRYGAVSNVFETDEEGHPVMGWCFLPSGNLVPGDVMLAQKISLESDEKAALLVARPFSANHW